MLAWQYLRVDRNRGVVPEVEDESNAVGEDRGRDVARHLHRAPLHGRVHRHVTWNEQKGE